jgi:hypothetical protein
VKTAIGDLTTKRIRQKDEAGPRRKTIPRGLDRPIAQVVKATLWIDPYLTGIPEGSRARNRIRAGMKDIRIGLGPPPGQEVVATLAIGLVPRINTDGRGARKGIRAGMEEIHGTLDTRIEQEEVATPGIAQVARKALDTPALAVI